MKTNYIKLGILLKWFPSAFYTVSISPSSINLQGDFHSETAKTALGHHFKSGGLSASGYIELRRGNITITLT